MKIRSLFLSALLLPSWGLPGIARTITEKWQAPSVTQPHLFIENKGQIVDQHGKYRRDIDYRLSATDVQVFLGKGKIEYQWSKPAGAAHDPGGTPAKKTQTSLARDIYRLDYQLVGANTSASFTREEASGYYEQYYLSQSGGKAVTAESFQKITYKNIYPAIDWVVYTTGKDIKYDFVVHPGGNVADIKMKYVGAASLAITGAGHLLVKTPMGELSETAPISFQEDGRRVFSHFVLKNGYVSFETGNYQGKLVIDPHVSWSTYYGGFAEGLEMANSTVTDQKGKVYLSGSVTSLVNIATTGAQQSSHAGETDAYVVQFNSAGVRQWGTYFGGPGFDGVGAGSWYTAIKLDTLDNIYLASATTSTSGIATAGAFQTTFKGGNASGTDAFLAKFNTAGKLSWATYYGGTGDESVTQNCLASDGRNIYLAAMTASDLDITTTGSHQFLYGGGGYDALLVKFRPDGMRDWATYYGGIEWELEEPAITCDRLGNIYMSGTTASAADIATPGSYQTAFAGANSWGDAFLVKFNPEGKRQWGTYFGGPGDDWAYGVSCDDSLNVFLTGRTNSTTGIASTGSFQNALGGDVDIFLAKFNTDGQKQWSTYFGGDGRDWAYAIQATPSGSVFLAGDTWSSTGIASPGALQTTYGGGMIFHGDAFMASFDARGQRSWGTYFGGSFDNAAYGMAYDRSGYLYICGPTMIDESIPTPGSHLDTFPGGFMQGFLAKFCLDIQGGEIKGQDSVCSYSTATYDVLMNSYGERISDENALYLWELPPGWEGSSTARTITVTVGNITDQLKVRIVRCNDTSEVITLPVTVFAAPKTIITVEGFVLGTAEEYETYQWYLNNVLIPGATNRSYTVKENGDYKVVTLSKGGCTDTSDVYSVSNVSIQNISIQDVMLYPNPVSGGKVYISSAGKVNIQVRNIEGKILLEQMNVKDLDVSHIPSGVYWLRISDENGQLYTIKKLVKW